MCRTLTISTPIPNQFEHYEFMIDFHVVVFIYYKFMFSYKLIVFVQNCWFSLKIGSSTRVECLDVEELLLIYTCALK